ncbi:MAG: GNAT family N-acetyltransferase [Planctomycetota bacterium]
MNEGFASLVATTPSSGLPKAEAIVPRGEVAGVGNDFAIRPGTADDLAWIDEMQKAHREQLGFLPFVALQQKIDRGEVLVAESLKLEGGSLKGQNAETDDPSASSSFKIPPSSFPSSAGSPRGFLIASDRYRSRDEVGLITQMCVVPEARRSLVAAALLQAQFDRSAYGCRLYSCWCAQDLEANRFWEAMGFVPIAFRTGSRKGRKLEDGSLKPEGSETDHSDSSSFKLPPSSFPTSPPSPRIHLFWQKKIRGADDPVAHWYPAKTAGGAMGADRLVFPIPPGVHWRDVLPVVLPETATSRDREEAESAQLMSEHDSAAGAAMESEMSASPTPLPDGRGSLRYPDGIEERDGVLWKDDKKLMTREMIQASQNVNAGGMWFIPRDVQLVEQLPEPEVIEPKRKKKKAKLKDQPVDPRLVAMARELRDRWHERPELAPLPSPKYDVRRTQLPETDRVSLTIAPVEAPRKLAA